MTGRQFIFRLMYLADIFSKINHELDTSKKKLTLSVANDKIWAFEKNLNFGKLEPGHQNLAHFPNVKDVFDELKGPWSHINECDLLNIT